MPIDDRISRRRLIKAATAAVIASPAYLNALRPAVAAKVSRLKVAIPTPAAQVTLGFMATNEGTGPLQPMYDRRDPSGARRRMVLDRRRQDVAAQASQRCQVPQWHAVHSEGRGQKLRTSRGAGLTLHDGADFSPAHAGDESDRDRQ